MPIATAPCGICGQPTDGGDSELIGGIWTPATCPDCGRRRLLADGGLVVQLAHEPDDARFALGEIQLRPGALHVLTESGEHYWPFLLRHVRGDAGVFAARTSTRAGRAFLNGRGHIVSEYRTSRGKRLWVITAPGTMTLLLAPGEY
jgi:hypothetical protein